jgi:hypothetical protein
VAAFIVPSLIDKKDPKNGNVPPVLPNGVVTLVMARRNGYSPLPATTASVTFFITLDGARVGDDLTTSAWPFYTSLDLTNVAPGVHALGSKIVTTDPQWQPFALPIIVGPVQATGVAPVCPCYQLQGIRTNEGPIPSYVDLGAF